MGNRIVSIIWATAFALAASGSAFAADMAVKAPAPMPAPVYNWTGWYVGVNAGASFGNVKTDFNEGSVHLETVDGSFDTPVFAGSDRTYPSGFIGGGQIGYNWQYSPLIVLGLEADIQGALEKDHSTITNNFSGPPHPACACPATLLDGVSPLVAGSTVLDYHTNIDWFGTVRARIGYVWGNGDVLSYLTGGLAYGKVGIHGTSTVSGTESNGDTTSPFSVTSAFSQSHVNIGWVVGYGTEGRLTGMPGWTWKVEGLYMDLGTLDASGPSQAAGPPELLFCDKETRVCSVGTSGGGVTTHSHFTDGILRGGLNYRF